MPLKSTAIATPPISGTMATNGHESIIAAPVAPKVTPECAPEFTHVM